MALNEGLLEAARILGVSEFLRANGRPEFDKRVVKAAYRKLIQLHAPDRDPEGFRRVRDAYEQLCDPGANARERLLRETPAVDPPELAFMQPTPRGATALALLRRMAAALDTTGLISEPLTRTQQGTAEPRS